MFTLKSITEGKIITDYQGIRVLKASANLDGEYSVVYTDGTELSGYAAYANDCAPNAYRKYLLNSQGLPKIEVLVALKPIEKDETICWEYRTMILKRENIMNLQKRELMIL